MAATAEVKTFWGALLSVLLKCIAALGITTPAARAAARTQSPATDRTDAVAVTPAKAGRTAAGHGLPGARGQAVPRVPAPRACEPARRERDRTLPPTMKQRIRAEAHGSSPSARSIKAGDLDELADITAGLALVGAAAATSGGGSESVPGSTAGISSGSSSGTVAGGTSGSSSAGTSAGAVSAGTSAGPVSGRTSEGPVYGRTSAGPAAVPACR